MTPQLRAQRVALVLAALALLAGATFGLALANATPEQRVAVSPVNPVNSIGVVATRAARVRRDIEATAAPSARLPTVTAPAPAPRVALDWRSVGSAGVEFFSISGQEWQLDLLCGGVPSDRVSGSALVMSMTSPTAGVTIDPLMYVCPAGAGGGQTTARFHDGGDFALSVDSPDPDVVWEILVTDIP
jgi:hypothetical protein